MIFCEKCFIDLEIQAIIRSLNHHGTCPICGSASYIYDTESDTSLNGLFDRVISVYTPFPDLPDEFPESELGSLAESVKRDWDIFNDIAIEHIHDILSSLAPNLCEDFPLLFSDKVGIAEKYDLDYLRDHHTILRAKEWNDFVDTIKHKNRFHSGLIDTEKLKEYCLLMQKDLPTGKQRYYRGRIARDRNGYSPSEMGAPPNDKATDGRANAVGISRLYLTDSKETTYHEIRAAEFDYVTIGTFKLMEPIKVVDLRCIESVSPSPFATESDDIDCTALAINRAHLKKIGQEIGKTMRRGDSPLDYIPTQYICDFIMSITNDDGSPMFDGIEYQSAMHSKGANLTIFYPEKFKCTYSKTFEVTQLKYTKSAV